jgi:hypothetical protein
VQTSPTPNTATPSCSARPTVCPMCCAPMV